MGLGCAMSDFFLLSEAEITSLFLSLKISGLAVLGALPVAYTLAYILAMTRFPGKFFLDVIAHLPLILPPIVMGYVLLILFGTQGIFGQYLQQYFAIRLAFDWKGAVLASALVTLPFQIQAIRLSLQTIDPKFRQAAASLGASKTDQLISIILPLSLPGLVSGFFTAFAASLGEFGAIITFAANIPGKTQTLPLAIYSALQSPGGEIQAQKLVVLSIMLAVSGLLIAHFSRSYLQKRYRLL